MKKILGSLICTTLTCLLSITPAHSWKNGGTTNAQTCSNPPYGTHDYIADKALSALPSEERKWLEPYKSFYLLGTEAPDVSSIPAECNTPNSGYHDMGKRNHSVRWADDLSVMTKVGAANRAQEEYVLAMNAYKAGKLSDAAYYLGAMTHYISDVASYPHTFDKAASHAKYEEWAERNFRTIPINVTKLEYRVPYDAVEKVSKAVFGGGGQIVAAKEMDQQWVPPVQEDIKTSSKESMNLAAKEIANVLHAFYKKVVKVN